MPELNNLVLRPPTLEDGMAVYGLIQCCSSLDMNSSYCNLLQCSHFANTSVAAFKDDELVGFISAYLKPVNPDTLFVWQVAVLKKARGFGVASRMLMNILSRSHDSKIKFIEASITQDNQASWALFKSLAKKLSADLHSSPWMDKEIHFAGQHDSESLVRIGPLTNIGNEN